MFTDIHAAMTAVADLLFGFSKKSVEDRIRNCSCMILICNELEKNLDRNWDAHDFAFRKLDAMRKTVEELWVGSCTTSADSVQDIEETISRILLLIVELESPDRWPSTCKFRDETGRVISGRNNPGRRRHPRKPGRSPKNR